VNSNGLSILDHPVGIRHSADVAGALVAGGIEVPVEQDTVYGVPPDDVVAAVSVEVTGAKDLPVHVVDGADVGGAGVPAVVKVPRTFPKKVQNLRSLCKLVYFFSII
jgi:hypothetical protein